MTVRPLICCFQVLGFRQELRSQPLWRGLKVCTLVAQPVHPLLQTVLVGPVIPADWWIVALKIPELRPTSHGRLQYSSDLSPTSELIFLLKMGDGDIAKGNLDRLDFHGIICAPEHNFLAGWPINQFHRLHLCIPVFCHSKLSNAPEILCVYTVSNRISYLSEHKGVSPWVVYQQQRN